MTKESLAAGREATNKTPQCIPRVPIVATLRIIGRASVSIIVVVDVVDVIVDVVDVVVDVVVDFVVDAVVVDAVVVDFVVGVEDDDIDVVVIVVVDVGVPLPANSKKNHHLDSKAARQH